jgi:hypothetical protein
MKSLDHLVRAVQHVRRNRQTDQFGGIQIYNELKLHGLLHGKIGWLGTFQDSIHVVSGRHSKFVGMIKKRGKFAGGLKSRGKDIGLSQCR